MAETNIERFIAKANVDQTTTPTNDHEKQQNQWNELAPGVDPSAYNPKPLPSNIAQTLPLPGPLPADIGRIPPLSFQPPSKSDIKDYFASPGVCGLLNLGNTCYMNAGLQCVFSIERIAKFYLNDNVPKPAINQIKDERTPKRQKQEINGKDHENSFGQEMEIENGKEITKDDTNSETGQEKENTNKMEKSRNDTTDVSRLCQGQISTSFSYLVRKLWTGYFSAIVPNNFKTVLGFVYSQFNGFRQQDCQEFLVVLLDRLHEEICSENGTTISSSNNGSNTSTVIADTFQGDLKSEVTCSRCGHISTKTDLFMYLSVPIPHAHERQIEIIWSSITRPPAKRKLIRCLVVIPKVSTVLHIKNSLCELLGGGISPDHVTLAHVKNSYIEFTLSDSLTSNHVKDKEFVIYGFETDPNNPPFNELSSKDSLKDSMNGYTQLIDQETMATNTTEKDHRDPWTVQSDSDSSDNMDTIPLVNNEDEAMPLVNNEDETTPLVNEVPDGTTPHLVPQTKVVVMEWHSCSICLEEMVDTDLLIHSSCGGLLCSDCLECSKQHSIKDDGKMPCPVCQKLIIHTKDFVPLANIEDATNIVRLLQITVMFRQEDSSGNWSLIGHPALINLPQNESIDYYYTTISALIPTHLSNEAWGLALTDGKGRFCSRCMYSSTQCRGCVLSNAMEDVNLKPGDHLCVTFRHLPEDIVTEAGESEHHSSLSDNRWSSLVTLQDCLQLFSQNESLGSNNLWWCPECKSNQEAIRQLSVSKLPSTVIVHLKRFLFQDAAASKVDISVSFPLSLSSSSFVNGKDITTVSDPDLILTGCVCHFGTLNSGHYTAYSRHPVSGSWHYYNDEIVTEAVPSDKDTNSVYILFYTSRRQENGECKLPVDRGMVSVSSEEELLHLEPILRLMKPKPAPFPPPLPPLKRSSSLGSVADSIGLQNVLPLDLASLLTANNIITSKHSASSSDNNVTVGSRGANFKSFEI